MKTLLQYRWILVLAVCLTISVRMTASEHVISDPCDRRVQIDEADPLGYRPRHDGGDPRCEGRYQLPVRGQQAESGIAVVACYAVAQRFDPAETPIVEINWMGQPYPVRIRAVANHRDWLYQMDAELTGTAIDRSDLPVGRFRWPMDVLSKANLEWNSISVSAWISDVQTKSHGDKPFRASRIVLPLVVNVPLSPIERQPDIEHVNDVPAEQNQEGNVTLQLGIKGVGPMLKDVQLRLEHLQSGQSTPINLREGLGSGTVRRVWVNVPATGDEWMLMASGHDMRGRKRNLEPIFIRVPDAAFVDRVNQAFRDNRKPAENHE